MSNELAWFKSSYSGGDGGQCVEVALTWFKSSYSGGDGGECVEVALPWSKSSYSAGAGGECVEVAGCASAVHVRDSKDVTRPAFTVATTAWAAFTASL
ncbi:DUF397 domain-containing protein [Streptomyces sp. NPDC090741]|uniref:DUF397 domain-containing protein n=1 Tax=Streptomyces sp. NPDC090741 TaxID=3365967 RepID=UPI0037FEB55B